MAEVIRGTASVSFLSSIRPINRAPGSKYGSIMVSFRLMENGLSSNSISLSPRPANSFSNSQLHGSFLNPWEQKTPQLQRGVREADKFPFQVRAAQTCMPRLSRWWEKGVTSNMVEVHSAQELIDSLLIAGDKLVVLDFYAPGCGACRSVHPKGAEIPCTEMFGTFSLAVGATVGMEYWAPWAHRALWHASLWHMHESHHRPREGPFELNDVFAIINAGPAIALLAYGFFNKGFVPGLCFGAGLGITVFGMAYMFVHDGLVHRRFPVGPIADVPYLLKVAAAHQHLKAAVQQGLFESLHRDLMVMFGKWDFDPLELNNPSPNNDVPVHMWQGDEDALVPVTLQRYISEKLSWIHYHEMPGVGHLFSLMEGIPDRILKCFLLGEQC